MLRRSPADRPPRAHVLAAATVLAALAAGRLRAETLTWPAAAAEARNRNPALAAAREAVLAAEAAVTVATAGFWPGLSAVGSAGRSGDQALDGSGGPLGSERDASSYSLGGQANWNLFAGGATAAARRRAKADLESRRQGLRAQSQTLRQSLRGAFDRLLYDQDNLALLADIRERLSQDARYLEIQFKAGREARWTFLKAQADVAGIEWQLAAARLDLATQQRALAHLLGRGPDGATALVASGDLGADAPPSDFAPLVAEMERRHPELLAQIAAVNSAEASLASSRSTRFPSLDARAGLTWSDANAWPPDDRLWTVGLSLNLPVFAGFGQEAAIAQSRHAWLGSLSTLADERSRLAAGLFAAWASYASSAAHVPVDQLNLAAAQERFKTVQSLYEAGQSAYLDFEQADSLLTSAQQQMLSAKLDLAQSAAGFEQAFGVTLDDEGATPP